MVTLAFATTAPVVSRVVPDRVPVNCWPKQREDATRKNAKHATGLSFSRADRSDFEVIYRLQLNCCDRVLQECERQVVRGATLLSALQLGVLQKALLTFSELIQKYYLASGLLFLTCVGEHCQEKKRFCWQGRIFWNYPCN